MKYIIFGLMLSVSGLCSAGQFSTGYGKITTLRSYGDLNPNMPTYIQVEGVSIKPACAHQDFGKGDLNYWMIKPEEKHLLSIVLAAYMSDQEVKVTSNDTSSFMHNGEVCRVVYIDLKT